MTDHPPLTRNHMREVISDLGDKLMHWSEIIENLPTNNALKELGPTLDHASSILSRLSFAMVTRGIEAAEPLSPQDFFGSGGKVIRPVRFNRSNDDDDT